MVTAPSRRAVSENRQLQRQVLAPESPNVASADVDVGCDAGSHRFGPVERDHVGDLLVGGEIEVDQTGVRLLDTGVMQHFGTGK